MLLWTLALLFLALSSIFFCLLLRSYYASKPLGLQSLLDPIKADLAAAHTATVNIFCCLMAAKAWWVAGLPRLATRAGLAATGVSVFTTVLLLLSHTVCWHLAVFSPGVLDVTVGGEDGGVRLVLGLRVASVVLAVVLVVHSASVRGENLRDPLGVGEILTGENSGSQP